MFGNRRANYRAFDGEADDDRIGNARFEDSSLPSRPLPFRDHFDLSFSGKSSMTRSKADHRWDHIENVDQFFTLIYEYHQGNGLLCIGLRQILSLFVFIYVVCFSTFLGQCIDYDIFFNNRNITTTGELIYGKRQFKNAIIPHCGSNLHPLVVLALFLAICFCLWQLICVGYHLLQLREIKAFYTLALEIDDSQLINIDWNVVVNRLCNLQPKLHLIINQEHITPLDVYQRILRYKNYFVALVYNDLLPPRVSLPFMGSFPFLSSGLRLNAEWLLFWGPWSPWKNSYALKSEYKDPANLEMLSEKMRHTIMWMGLVNLVLFPFIFVYQIIFHFFSYADSVKREPGIFSTRKYANYGRERLRHFNELDHELQARLNRSYSFAVRYMDQFFSPVTEIVAAKVALIVGSIFAVLALFSAWDEDVLAIEHVITVMAVCGTVAMICRSLIPNENLVYCQDFLMRQIVANIHYAPRTWLEEAQSSEVCHEFSQLFQLRAQCLMEELISPIVTPFILFFSMRQRASEFVLFFHNNTKYVEGLGDVCSYAQMDISTDGDMRLASLNDSLSLNNPNELKLQDLRRTPVFCGKVELSLLNFATMNPDWVPPPVYAEFINRVRKCTAEMLAQNPSDAILPNTLQEMDESVRDGNFLGDCAPTSAAAAAVTKAATFKTAAPLTPLAIVASVNSTPTNQTINQPNRLVDTSLQRPAVASGSGSAINSDKTASYLQHLSDSSMIASLSNMNSFLKSFVSTNQFHMQPRNVIENKSRMLEMSYNALALNRILAANQPTGLSSTNGELPVNNNRRLAAGAGSYGAFGPSQYGSGGGVSQYVASTFGQLPSRYMVGGAASTTTSNVWGVPELSEPLLNEDADVSLDYHQHRDDSRLPLYSP